MGVHSRLWIAEGEGLISFSLRTVDQAVADVASTDLVAPISVAEEEVCFYIFLPVGTTSGCMRSFGNLVWMIKFSESFPSPLPKYSCKKYQTQKEYGKILYLNTQKSTANFYISTHNFVKHWSPFLFQLPMLPRSVLYSDINVSFDWHIRIFYPQTYFSFQLGRSKREMFLLFTF